MTMGHAPIGIYTIPHWDIHFFLAPKDLVESVGAGPCGEGGDCAWYKKCGVPPVRGNTTFAPGPFLGSLELGAFAAGQGMHMVDFRAPEFAPLRNETPAGPFNMSWIYGTCQGDIWFWVSIAALGSHAMHACYAD